MASSKRAAHGSGTIRKKTVTRNGQDYTYWEARITMPEPVGRSSALLLARRKRRYGKNYKRWP